MPLFFQDTAQLLLVLDASLALQTICLVATMITHLCNLYPITPHIFIVKFGFTEVHIFFLLLLYKINCGYSLEPPHRGGSKVYPQSMFLAKIRNQSRTNGPINAHLTIAQAMPKYNHNNEKQEALL